MTVSRDTYIADMRAPPQAGIRCRQTLQTGFPIFEWNSINVAAAQRILLPFEPFVFTDQHAEEIKALSNAPVTRIDGEMVSWYGSRAIPAMTYLAELRQRCCN